MWVGVYWFVQGSQQDLSEQITSEQRSERKKGRDHWFCGILHKGTANAKELQREYVWLLQEIVRTVTW